MGSVLEVTQHVAQGETLETCEELVYDTSTFGLVLVCVAVCNCQPAARQTVECKRKRDQTE